MNAHELDRESDWQVMPGLFNYIMTNRGHIYIYIFIYIVICTSSGIYFSVRSQVKYPPIIDNGPGIVKASNLPPSTVTFFNDFPDYMFAHFAMCYRFARQNKRNLT